MIKLSSVPVLGPIASNPAFRLGDFRRLWAGASLNYVGSAGEQVIFSLLVFQLTGSSAWVGISLSLYYAPLAIFGVLAGAIADWMDRRSLLRRLEIAIAANLLVFAALTAFGVIQLWQVLLMTATAGSFRAMYQPARASYAFDLVGGEQVVAGLGLLNLGVRAGQFVGALVAGSTMQRMGPEVALSGLAFVHVLAYFVLRKLRSVGSVAAHDRTSLVETFREYLAEMRSNRTLLMLVVVTASVEVLGFSFATVLPELATRELGVGAEGLGILHAIRALGGLFAGGMLAAYGHFRRRGLAYLSVLFSFGAGLLLLAGSSNFTLTLLAVAMVASLATVSDILSQSMMQLCVPDRLRGRAMGVWVFAIGTAPLGHIEMGALASSFGVAAALGINGGVLIVIGVITVIVAPRLRQL